MYQTSVNNIARDNLLELNGDAMGPQLDMLILYEPTSYKLSVYFKYFVLVFH